MSVFQKLVCRFKHPISMPEDVGKDLGVQVLYNEVSFQECIDHLTDSHYRPKNLVRFMSRKKAESQFKSAVRKEIFAKRSLFSYYIYQGWLSFELVFDSSDQLRRVYMQHRNLDSPDLGVEIPLKS
ncbi:MAG: hypothetical protein S4CHLAM7_02690 [Chlamydiae bacterium]|nr:hypothetical protein [Chlamydiota bacterium]